MICASLRPPPTHSQLGVGCCRIWASCRSRSLRWRSSCRRRSHAVRSCPWSNNGPTRRSPAAAADRACQQQREALSDCERPDAPVEGGRPRSRDGAVLCPAQFPGAPESLAAYDLIGINSNVLYSLLLEDLSIFLIVFSGLLPAKWAVVHNTIEPALKVLCSSKLNFQFLEMNFQNERTVREHIHDLVIGLFINRYEFERVL
jgi:hypothetical protein